MSGTVEEETVEKEKDTYCDSMDELTETILSSDYVALIKGANTALLPCNIVIDLANMLRRGIASTRLATKISSAKK